MKLAFLNFKKNVHDKWYQTMVSRTGYTGEDGFEIYCDSEDAPALWRAILEAGKEEGYSRLD